MDYSLQVHGAKYIFPVPDGLKELSSDIVREVLRHQPEHINGFIADYLETMLVVREKARDSGVIVCDVLQQGLFFDELFKLKNVTREQANAKAIIIQSGWRGYVVRRKLQEYLKKKKKFIEEKQKRISIRIEELLAGLGITYNEATRAAEVIQTAYKQTKRGRWVQTEAGEIWIEEYVPFGQRIREEDTVKGRFDRWEKEDFGEFFELDHSGAIRYDWPKVGQLRKVPRNTVTQDVPTVEFFAMRDLEGKEQYTYLIKHKPGTEKRGVPIGFLVPIPSYLLTNDMAEVEFKNPEYRFRMGSYVYVFRDDVDRTELKKFETVLKAKSNMSFIQEAIHEDFDYDPDFVVPRLLIRIRQKFLLDTDDEVKFKLLPEKVVCEETQYTFRAETIEQTARTIRNILRYDCLTVEEGLQGAGYTLPYREQLTGRIFPVDNFTKPSYIQKIIIKPESNSGDEESTNVLQYEYVFIPPNLQAGKKYPGAAPVISIPIVRFQGYHSEFQGSDALQDKVFVLGPLIKTPDGKPFTHESLFWDEFGSEAWHQLLYEFYSALESEEMQGEEAEGEEYEEIPADLPVQEEPESVAKETESERPASSQFEQTETKSAKTDEETVTTQPEMIVTPPQTDVIEKELEGEYKMEESEMEPEGPEEDTEIQEGVDKGRNDELKPEDKE